jgi:Flp pilus assembly protein TadG
MRAPFIRRPLRSTAPRANERGVTIALVALAIFSIIAMAGISIDVGTLYQASAEAQRSADAAALAAARELAISGMTGDPSNVANQWATVCAAATQVAQTVAAQNTIGGSVPSGVSVTYISGDQQSNCSSAAGTAVSFGVNPTVTVQVTQANLPTYFARIWGRTANTVSATATAEAFNPSNSGAYSSTGSIVPVQPRCVKPWIIPNRDPLNPSGKTCTGSGATGCNPFVNIQPGSDGTIQNPGILINSGGKGVIGESFIMFADCPLTGGGSCILQNTIPTTNLQVGPKDPPPNIEYLPAALSGTSPVAIPSCGNDDAYQEAIAGCDQSTQYQCGVLSTSASSPTTIDLTENPNGSTGDTFVAASCLINESKGAGQDSLVLTSYPYPIEAGGSNPLNVPTNTVITNSTSIVTIPIYDDTQVSTITTGTAVTIVGFLQVFIQNVNADGSLAVIVMNISACGNAVSSSTTAITGSSPVPVRLITPP